MAELGLSPDGVDGRFRDNVIPYPSVPDARESLELVKAFKRIRDAHKRSELLEVILKAAGR